MAVHFHPAYPWKVFDRFGSMRSRHWRIVRAIEALRRAGDGASLRYCDTLAVWTNRPGAPPPCVADITTATRTAIANATERRRRFERGA